MRGREGRSPFFGSHVTGRRMFVPFHHFFLMHAFPSVFGVMFPSVELSFLLLWHKKIIMMMNKMKKRIRCCCCCWGERHLEPGSLSSSSSFTDYSSPHLNHDPQSRSSSSSFLSQHFSLCPSIVTTITHSPSVPMPLLNPATNAAPPPPSR